MQYESEFVYDGYEFLGWQNSWEVFDILWLKQHKPKYIACMEETHNRHSIDEGRCVTLTFCPTCKIYWRTDSGD